jgi:hypothetical protein
VAPDTQVVIVAATASAAPAAIRATRFVLVFIEVLRRYINDMISIAEIRTSRIYR